MNPRYFAVCLLAVVYQTHGQAIGTNVVEMTWGLRDIQSYLVARGPWTEQAEAEQRLARSSKLAAAGEWSEPVSDGHGNKLRGRVLIYRGGVETNWWSNAPVYLEIQDLAGTNKPPTEVYFDDRAFKYGLQDAEGWQIPGSSGGSGASGGTSGLWCPLAASCDFTSTTGGLSGDLARMGRDQILAT